MVNEQLTYKDIVDKIYLPEMQHYVKDGLAYSRPLPGKTKSKLVDCFFSFVISMEDNVAIGPLAMFRIDAQEGKLMVGEDIDRAFHKEIVLHEIENITEMEFGIKQYENLYPTVRQFAFATPTTPQQKQMLGEFLDALKIVAMNEDLLGIYKSLAPEFFFWSGQALKSG
ncbi:MAG: hypothetical protein LBR56_03595 [Sporomusaceae bacterium]|jgi:hypothetical protein|nr:hypothetical protein [Sporomusaceae bacterium]